MNTNCNTFLQHVTTYQLYLQYCLVYHVQLVRYLEALLECKLYSLLRDHPDVVYISVFIAYQFKLNLLHYVSLTLFFAVVLEIVCVTVAMAISELLVVYTR